MRPVTMPTAVLPHARDDAAAGVSGFSPEQRLVIDAVRHVLSNRTETPIPAVVDWRLTLALADRQGLAPYLLAAIEAFDPPPSPRFVAAIRARSLSAEAKARD